MSLIRIRFGSAVHVMSALGNRETNMLPNARARVTKEIDGSPQRHQPNCSKYYLNMSDAIEERIVAAWTFSVSASCLACVRHCLFEKRGESFVDCMSGTAQKRSADAVDPVDEERVKRPRAEDNAAAAPPLPLLLPPVSKLYAHALHCIFAFLPLSDRQRAGPTGLAAVVQVSKSWCAAIGSVGPASVGCASVQSLTPLIESLLSQPSTSGLALHVTNHTTRILLDGWLTPFIRRLPNLRILRASIPMPAPAVFAFPLRLTELDLHDDAVGERTNTLLTAVAQLSQLVKFRLRLARTNRSEAAIFSVVNFTLLYDAPKLTDFWLNFPELGYPQGMHATNQQIEDLRALPLQLILPCDPDANSNLTARLLQPPHTLRYECIARNVNLGLDSNVNLCNQLRHLPSLTELNALLNGTADQLDFLAPLVNLTQLDLCDTAPAGLPTALLLPSLLGMTRLTKLALRRCSFTSDHLAQLLLQLPLLKQLTLENCRNIQSTHFLAAAASSLTQLQLLACPIRPELAHFSSLHSLTHLIVGCKNTAMDAFETAQWRGYIPPCPLIPNLCEFEFVIILSDGAWLRSFKLA